MPAGRPPKPTEMKRALGNPGHRPLPPVLEILPSPTSGPVMPAGLRKDGQAEWMRAQLAPWIRETDAGALTDYCRAVDEQALWRSDLRREGRYTTGSMGQRVAHPAVAELRRLAVELRALRGELGLTAVSRTRMGVSLANSQSKLDEFKARRQAG